MNRQIFPFNSRLRHMIERDQIYKDYPVNTFACQMLNSFNSQQEHELVNGQCQYQPSPYIPKIDSEAHFAPFDIDRFLHFGKMQQTLFVFQQKNQLQNEISPEKEPQIENCQDSGGTKFDSIIPKPLTLQAQMGIAFPKNSKPQQKDYNKNLACYISKIAHKIMFDKCRRKTMKLCQRQGIPFEQFALFCDKKKLSGINGLKSYYQASDNATESTMKKIFQTLFQKILRRAYLRTVIEEGKMTNLQAYIEYKNKFLLNLDQ